MSHLTSKLLTDADIPTPNGVWCCFECYRPLRAGDIAFQRFEDIDDEGNPIVQDVCEGCEAGME